MIMSTIKVIIAPAQTSFLLLCMVFLHSTQTDAMHVTGRSTVARTMACTPLSSHVTLSLRRQASSINKQIETIRSQRACVLTTACCRKTPQFDSTAYTQAGGNFNSQITRNEYGRYTHDAFECDCAAPWPPSEVAHKEYLLDHILTFKTQPIHTGDTLLHSLPACRTKMLLLHGADISARNFKTLFLGQAEKLKKYDPLLLTRIETASRDNGNRYVHLGINGLYYFVGKDGTHKVAQGVSRSFYRDEADYSYHRLTPLMGAIYHYDFPKFKLLLAAVSQQDVEKDILDLQIIAGYARLRNRLQKGRTNLQIPSEFEEALFTIVK